MKSWALLSSVLLLSLFVSMSATADTVYADVTHCGSILADETWTAADNVHIITCDVTVAAGVTLTITEGAIVKVDIGEGFYVDGSLRVEGTEANPVNLTSLRDDSVGGDTNADGGATTPSRGDWRGVEFRDGSDDANSLIDYALIRYTGIASAGNIILSGASPTIQNSALTDGHMAIRADLDSFPVLTNNTYSDNSYNALGYEGGTVDQDAVWDVTDVSYYLLGEVSVQTGRTLTIKPGVVIKGPTGYEDLVVDGALRVEGTVDDPVYLTSLHDDTVGGDTNNNGGATTPGQNDWGGVEFRPGSDDENSVIDHAVIRYGGANLNGNINLISASPTIQNTELTHANIAIRANLESFPVLDNNTYSDNNFNALGYDGGTIDQDTIWDVTDTSYYIIDSVFVAAGQTLTIGPGVIVKVNVGYHDLVVDGALRIEGTATDPVYLTSITDDTIGGDTNYDGGATVPGRNDWRGVQFRAGSDDANSLIDHAVIRYAGNFFYGNVNLIGASPTIQNTALTDGHIAIRADLDSFPVLINNSYSDNNYNAFGYDGGAIDQDADWDITDTSYLIIDDVFVAAGQTLTIEPGVVIKFEAAGRKLVIDGALRIEGTQTQPVYLTSVLDDNVGGDTNGDGGATTPFWSDWGGVDFRDGSNDVISLIDYATIRYGGNGARGNIDLTGASPTIQNSALTDGFHGILAEDAQPILTCNSILDNDSHGLFNATTAVVIDAREQWWGSPSGPYHETLNPGGSGNEVTDGVLFSPWDTSSCGTAEPPRAVFLPTVTK